MISAFASVLKCAAIFALTRAREIIEEFPLGSVIDGALRD
jgi:hypothetical protein